MNMEAIKQAEIEFELISERLSNLPLNQKSEVTSILIFMLKRFDLKDEPELTLLQKKAIILKLSRQKPPTK